tara:strand:+ start:4860 stop:9512 length:4653 start_codon:yes stop_codon:yes gene_type:complete
MADLAKELQLQYEKILKEQGQRSADAFLKDLRNKTIVSPNDKTVAEKDEREKLIESKSVAAASDPRTSTTKDLTQLAQQNAFISEEEIDDSKINVLIRTQYFRGVLEDGEIKDYGTIFITYPNDVSFSNVTAIEFVDPEEFNLSYATFSSDNTRYSKLKFRIKGASSSEARVKVTWANGWEKIFNLFIPYKRPFQFDGTVANVENSFFTSGISAIQTGSNQQGTLSCNGEGESGDEGNQFNGDYQSFSRVDSVLTNNIDTNLNKNKTLHTFTRVVEDPANLWSGYLPWFYDVTEDILSVLNNDEGYKFRFQFLNSSNGNLNSPNNSSTFSNGTYLLSNSLNVNGISWDWEQDQAFNTFGLTGASLQEQQVQHIQSFSSVAEDVSLTDILLGLANTDNVFTSSLFLAHAESKHGQLANDVVNASVFTYDNFLQNLDGDYYIGTDNSNPLSYTSNEFVSGTDILIGTVLVPTYVRTPAIGWTTYSKNLTPCSESLETFYVCLETGNTNNFNTTGLDCDGNAIPAAYLNGTLSANFVDGDCCSFDCNNSGFNSDISNVDNATYNTADGKFKFTIFDTNGDGIADSGFPTTSGGSQFTIALSSPSGETITQTMPANQGASTGISCITNTTAATAHQITLAGGAESDLISPGMQITGTGIPAGTFVGIVLVGAIGADSTAGVSKFTLVDVTGQQVSATTAATNTLQFSMGYSIEFGSLSAGDYTVTVTNSEDCTYLLSTTINENAAPEGCTDSTSLNYDSTAVIDNQTCIFCDAVSGNLVDSTGELIEEGIASNSLLNVISPTAPLGDNNDGTIQAAFSLYGIVIQSLTTNMSYTMTLFSHPTIVDQGLNTNATQVAQQTGLAVASHNFTGLGYGFYSVKLEIEDSSTGADAGVEKCFSTETVSVKVSGCIDSTANNFASYQAIPVELIEEDNSLCTYDCNLGAQIQLNYDSNDSCAAPYIAVDVQYNEVSSGGSNNLPNATLSIIWEEDGVQINSPFVQNNVFGSGNLTNVLSSPTTGFNGITSGAHVYTATVEISSNGKTSQFCTAVSEMTITIPECGCTDNDPNTNGGVAYNYNPLANTDDGTCIYQSYNCNPLTFQCTDPLDGSGVFQDYNTCIQNACTPPTIGCTDPNANNYDANAEIADNDLCEYSACLDPNSIQIDGQYGMYYNCEGQYLPTATINQNTCCVYCSGNEPLEGTSTTTNASITSNCLTNADGSFSISASTSELLVCTGWSITIQNSNGQIDLSSNTGINNNATFTTGNILSAGAYTYTITDDCYGCETNGTFFITADSSSCGCTDPTADNYDSVATSDDGSCLYCGCTDPLAVNYDPNAVCADGSCRYIFPTNPCQLDAKQKKSVIDTIENCISNKGLSFLNKLKTGLVDDCSVMNTWKLILIDYLLKSHGGELDCLYNCQSNLLPDTPSNNINCADKAATGGPNTGLNDQGFAGSTYSASTGTVITDPSLFFVQENELMSGDVITMPSGNIWEVVPSAVSCTFGCNNPESSLSKTSQHWTLCQQNNVFTYTTTVDYLDKFINFANKFCADCATDFIAK